jgi:hypothetical protein
MDRQVLSILAPTLQHSIGWTEQQYGGECALAETIRVLL